MKKIVEFPQPPTVSDAGAEVERLKKFLAEKNLEIDPRFFAEIRPGDIIEVYAVPENVQIFFNDEFMKHSSYTPEQMSTIPFPKLFWRSDADHLALMRRAAHVATNENGAVPWGLPSHELVESLHPRRRTFEMRMGWIAPCFEAKTKARKAWASTLQVALVFEWQESLA